MESINVNSMLDYKLKKEQLYYRSAGIVMLCAFAGLLLMRILMSFLPEFPDSYAYELLYDVIFSVPLQIGVLMVIPYFIYKLRFKMSFKQIMAFSNVKKPPAFVMLLCVPLAFFLYFFSMGVSILSVSFLSMLGCNLPTASTPLPQTFNFGFFIASLFLTAVLPAVCEEFLNRGIFLSVLKGSYKKYAVVFIGAITFGLFHQYIYQFFYTMVFGVVATYLVYKYKSIWPAVLVHFLNNAFSVYLEYASAYNWVMGGYFDFILKLNEHGLFFVAFAFMGTVSVLILFIMRQIESKLNPTFKADTQYLFKPALVDNSFFIGAAVIAALTTIFTFAWGFFY